MSTPSTDQVQQESPQKLDKGKAKTPPTPGSPTVSSTSKTSSRRRPFPSYTSDSEPDESFLDRISDEADISLDLDAAKSVDDVFTQRSSDSFHPSLGFTPSLHRLSRAKYQFTAASPSLRHSGPRIPSRGSSKQSGRTSSPTPASAAFESFDVSDLAQPSSSRRKRTSTPASGLEIDWDQMDIDQILESEYFHSQDDNDNLHMQYVQVKRELRKRDHELAITAAVANKALGMHKNLIQQLPATVKERMPKLVHLSRAPSRDSLAEPGPFEAPPPPQPGLRPFLTRSTLSNEWLNNSNSTTTRADSRRSSPDVGYQDDADTHDEFETADDKSPRLDRRAKSPLEAIQRHTRPRHSNQQRNQTPRTRFAAAKHVAIQERLFMLEVALAESRHNEVAQRRLAASYKTQADNLQRLVEQKQALRAHFANLSAYSIAADAARSGSESTRYYTAPSYESVGSGARTDSYHSFPPSYVGNPFGAIGSRPQEVGPRATPPRSRRTTHAAQVPSGAFDLETPMHTSVMAIREYSPSPRSSLLSSNPSSRPSDPRSLTALPTPESSLHDGMTPVRHRPNDDNDNSVQAIENNLIATSPWNRQTPNSSCLVEGDSSALVSASQITLDSSAGEDIPHFTPDQAAPSSSAKKLRWADTSTKVNDETPTRPKSKSSIRTRDIRPTEGSPITRQRRRAPVRAEPSPVAVRESSAEPTTIPAKLVHDAFCVFLLFIEYVEFFFVIGCRILIAIRYGTTHSSRVDSRPRPKRYYF